MRGGPAIGRVAAVCPSAANDPHRMTKSELIEILAQRQAHLKADDVDLAVKSLLEMMGSALADGERIEIRGFGSFSLHYRPPRTGPQPEDRRRRRAARQARPAFQARQGTARARQRRRAVADADD